MIKYNSNTINDWYFDTSNIIKVYRNNAVCYYKITNSGGTSVQTPCFAVVDNISQYSDTEFEDVFDKADNKWYKLNNLNQYEQYGIYDRGRTSCSAVSFTELTDIIAQSTTALTNHAITVTPAVGAFSKIRIDTTKSATTTSYCWITFTPTPSGSEVLGINMSSIGAMNGYGNNKNYVTDANGSQTFAHWVDDNNTIVEIDIAALSNNQASELYLLFYQENCNTAAFSFYFESTNCVTTYEGKLTVDEEITPSPSRLPNGYTEVEYIQNTGASYINTELQLCSSTTNTFQVEAKLASSRIGSDTYQNIFACMSEVGEPYQGFTYRFFGSNISPVFIPSNDGSFTQVSNQDGTTSVTVSSTNGLTYSHTYPLTICCGLNSSRNPFRYTNTKVYTFKVTLNNDIVADYVPAQRDSDDKYGLYDLITDTFYTSPNGNNFSGGSAVTPPPTTATCEFIYSGNSWVNVGEVSGSTATLPNVPFTVNYNAKNYDSNSKTLLKTSGQLANVDAAITAGTPTVGNGYLTIASGTRATISGYQTYFNRDSSNPNLTIISKQTTDGNNCHMFANRDSSYNWMYRCYSNKLTLHGSSETGGVAVTTQPVVESVRVDSGRNITYNNYTNNTTSGTTGFNYGGTNSGEFAIFAGYGTSSGEWFVGDFYWVYMSQNTLTDEQVQQVIDYNEGGGSQPIYPLEYVVREDPPDNLTFSSMAEAEAYECPWVGMNARINGDKYVFSGNSTSGYEWVYNPSRLPQGYTEVEYIENSSTAYINLGVSPYSANGNSFIVESTFSSFTQSSLAYLISSESTKSPYYGFVLRWVNNNLQLDGASIGIDTTATNNPNVDGTSAITFYSDSTTTSNNNTPITLFCGMSGSSPWRNGKGKCYSFKLTINNNIVRDLIPCMRDSDNKYGMYDIVNDVFYLSPNNVNFSGGNPV